MKSDVLTFTIIDLAVKKVRVNPVSLFERNVGITQIPDATCHKKKIFEGI